MEERKAFLGTGLKFPVQVEKGTGRFALSKEEDSVKESVYIILMTQRGERLLEPGFGCGLLSYTFMDMSATRLNLMKNEIRSALMQQEPRIEDVEVRTEDRGKEGCLLVHVIYRICGTNTVDNLVFPFYLHNASGEEGYENKASAL